MVSPRGEAPGPDPWPRHRALVAPLEKGHEGRKWRAPAQSPAPKDEANCGSLCSVLEDRLAQPGGREGDSGGDDSTKARFSFQGIAQPRGGFGGPLESRLRSVVGSSRPRTSARRRLAAGLRSWDPAPAVSGWRTHALMPLG